MPLRKKLASDCSTFSGGVDFALAEAGAQLFHGDVDVDHFVGALEEVVGDGLADDGVGGAVDGVVQRLKVLDVDGGHHVDAGVEQVEHVLIALAVLAAGDVGVGQLIHDHGVGMAGQDGVHVHLLELDAAVGNHAQGHDFEVANLRPRSPRVRAVPPGR